MKTITPTALSESLWKLQELEARRAWCFPDELARTEHMLEVQVRVLLDMLRAESEDAQPPTLPMIGKNMLQPPIAVLCGRTVHREAYRLANALLTLRGYIVLSCGVFKGDPEWGEDAKVNLDELHRSKIELADIVVVVEPSSTGQSTEAEILFAKSLGRPIYEFDLATRQFSIDIPTTELP